MASKQVHSSWSCVLAAALTWQIALQSDGARANPTYYDVVRGDRPHDQLGLLFLREMAASDVGGNDERRRIHFEAARTVGPAP